MPPSATQPTVLIVFALVYLGMLLGRLPGLALDRTGVALCGALALIATGCVSLETAWGAIDPPTIALLFGLMIVSAQLRLAGFYTRLTEQLGALALPPAGLLAWLVGATGLLSSVLANDIVCLAGTPILIDVCVARRLDPKPFLLALACAANVGSAATLIGNPQNMLIGEALDLSFARYLLVASVPTLLGLLLVWGIIAFAARGRWQLALDIPPVEHVPFDGRHTAKTLAVLALLIAAFLWGRWPRAVTALAAAGFLLLSRRTPSRRALALVDGQLLLLFAGLFVVNHAFAASGLAARALDGLAARGLDLTAPALLFVAAAVLSCLVSNVPAVMLLLPAATHPGAGPLLALSSTLAGNLFLVASIANLIVVEESERRGLRIDWRTHARVGVPVTLVTWGLAGAWLYLLA